MVRNNLLRKQYAKLRTDGLIHNHLASVSKSPDVKRALVLLLVYVHTRTDWLGPMPLGGQPSWARADWFMKGLVALARSQAHWLRDVHSWEPSGNSSLRQFGSLARHLLTNHPVPNFMDLVWLSDPSQEASRKQKWFRHLGLGYSIRGTDIPLRLTKKMAYHFMHAPDHYIVEEAFRWGQILGFGGEPKLVQAVISTRLGHSFEHESYWERIIRFFVRNADLVVERIGPIVEYLRFKKHVFRLEPPLREKRRAVERLLEQVAKWQPPMTINGHSPSLKWSKTGIGGLEYDDTQGWTRRTWAIRELLDSNELRAEGRAMRHCVATYAHRCIGRRSSIWSMTCYSCLGQENLLTIEVDPNTRTIVQAKGRHNGHPSAEARSIMMRWADREGLRVADCV
jgi:hypothetical protein